MTKSRGATDQRAVTITIDLDQLIAAACSLPSEARQRLREALEAVADERDGWLESALTSEGNPVLAELWDNEHDAVYDNL
jgi:hypothetical protein